VAGISYQGELRDAGQTLARAARVAFGDWLSTGEWDWYTTHTFRDEVKSPRVADKHWYAWFNSLSMVNRHYGLGRPFYFRVTELQQRGVLHHHALIGGVDERVRRRLFKELWQLHGFARVEKYNPQLGAAHYVGKYLTKDSEQGDIRFSHNLAGHLTRDYPEGILEGKEGGDG